MADNDDLYPPVGFHFLVDFGIENLTAGDFRFQEVSGLSVEIETETLEEGGENRFVHKLPKRPKYGNLVLKRGLLNDSEVISWVTEAVESFVFQPVTVLVTLLNEESEPLVSWSFANAWPVKWVVSDFKAQENSLVIETLELSYSRFKKV
ncbi:phage tail protein [Maridesulfovibrio sp.]|uniref:phage tail protein n=1 Tax=Maridesulfovibrio sp. TaxID=2795000 RepID=UPI0039F09AD9